MTHATNEVTIPMLLDSNFNLLQAMMFSLIFSRSSLMNVGVDVCIICMVEESLSNNQVDK
mgnify:FL=1